MTVGWLQVVFLVAALAGAALIYRNDNEIAGAVIGGVVCAVPIAVFYSVKPVAGLVLLAAWVVVCATADVHFRRSRL